MAIPDYETIMKPLLESCLDGNEHNLRDTSKSLAIYFNLTPEELTEKLPSGKMSKFYNRLGWARTYLAMAGLLDAPKRGVFRITDIGRDVLSKSPERIDNKFLRQFSGFNDFQSKSNKKENSIDDELEVPKIFSTPEESLDGAFQQIQEALADEILAKVKSCSPDFFENLVVELLVAMGYGGSRADAGQKIGRSGDEGIDGIIKEDRLGLDVIYIQAKRWEGIVGRPEIQKFVGALAGKKAKKGVFITTSDFTKDAKDYADNLDAKVILIDGKLLARYMINFDVAVSTIETYKVKRLDSDYFIEE